MEVIPVADEGDFGKAPFERSLTLFGAKSVHFTSYEPRRSGVCILRSRTLGSFNYLALSLVHRVVDFVTKMKA